LFERWDWLDRKQFREEFGLTDITQHTDTDIARATRYGCMRVDVECGGSISAILDGRKFPGNLTQNQADTILEASSWCANHVLKQGLEWLRGSASVNIGQISTGQTNPEEPDYFLPFLYKKLEGAGLVKCIHAGNIGVEREDSDPMFTWKDTDSEFYPPSLDFLKKTYIAKRGQNSLTSRDGSVVIKPNGGLYDGVDISVEASSETLKKLRKELLETINQIDEELRRLDKKLEGVEPISDNLQEIDGIIEVDRGSYPPYLVYSKDIGDRQQNPLALPPRKYVDRRIAETEHKVIQESQERKVADLKLWQGIDSIPKVTENLKDIDNAVLAGGNKIVYRYNPTVENSNDIPNKKYVDDKTSKGGLTLPQAISGIASWKPVRQDYTYSRSTLKYYDNLYIPGFNNVSSGYTDFHNSGIWRDDNDQNGDFHSLHLHGWGS